MNKTIDTILWIVSGVLFLPIVLPLIWFWERNRDNIKQVKEVKA